MRTVFWRVVVAALLLPVVSLTAQTTRPPLAAVDADGPAGPARRVVSVVPAVTEMLFAVGAGPQVVAVSSFDHFPPAVEALPKVGALLDPDTERILTLRPDLVVLYGSQTDLQARLARAGIRTYMYRHGGLAHALRTIEDVGAATGRAQQAAAVTSEMRRRLEALRTRLAGRARPRTLLVISRQPGSLRALYASGAIGFLHEVLEAAGGQNVFADVARESVQPSQETLLERRPEVVIELQANTAKSSADEARRAWAPLQSLPAVRLNRLHALGGSQFVIAGPRLADAAEAVARALHPGAF